MPLKPKPTALKLVEGNPSKRAISEKEPKPEVVKGVPAPTWMAAEAAREAERLGAAIESLKQQRR